MGTSVDIPKECAECERNYSAVEKAIADGYGIDEYATVCKWGRRKRLLPCRAG
jgi:hypothetical protein